MDFFALGLAGLSSNIVEIGCGCGRNAYVLKQFQKDRQKFFGQYLGIDIDSEAIHWCQSHLADGHFSFDTSTHSSRFYKTEGIGSDDPLTSLDAQSQDFVFATAVFSHILGNEIRDYIRATARILRPGGHIFFTCRLLDHMPTRYRARFGTDHQGAFVVDPDKPEKSVAFWEGDIRRILDEHGFTDVRVEPRGPLNHVMIARRAASPGTESAASAAAAAATP
jgi:SAM-dependent methyltransferase